MNKPSKPHWHCHLRSIQNRFPGAAPWLPQGLDEALSECLGDTAKRGKSPAGISETHLFTMSQTSCQIAHKNLHSQNSTEQRERGKQTLGFASSEYRAKPSQPTPLAGRRKRSTGRKQRIVVRSSSLAHRLGKCLGSAQSISCTSAADKIKDSCNLYNQ